MDAESFGKMEALKAKQSLSCYLKAHRSCWQELWLLLCLPMPCLFPVFLIQVLSLIMEPKFCLCPGDKDTCERFAGN